MGPSYKRLFLFHLCGRDKAYSTNPATKLVCKHVCWVCAARHSRHQWTTLPEVRILFLNFVCYLEMAHKYKQLPTTCGSVLICAAVKGICQGRLPKPSSVLRWNRFRFCWPRVLLKSPLDAKFSSSRPCFMSTLTVALSNCLCAAKLATSHGSFLQTALPLSPLRKR